MTTSLCIISVAPGASVQDAGRQGYLRYGVTESGVMDNRSYREGAALLANSPAAAAIEFSGRGGEFEVANGAVNMACSGAVMDLKVDNKPVPWNSSFRVEPGQRVVIGAALAGVYGYLHVAGGFDVPMVLGSRSTHARAGFGGLQGRCLRSGDSIPLLASDVSMENTILHRQHQVAKVIRFVWGVQAHLFSVEQRKRFENSVFVMSAARDRMGARLNCSDNNVFAANSGLSGISDAVIAGDIQIGGDGMATVLLADRQPTGGYPRIATVIAADLDNVAQLPILSEFRFQSVSLQTAVEELISYRQQLDNLPACVEPLIRDPRTLGDLLNYNLISGVTDGTTEE